MLRCFRLLRVQFDVEFDLTQGRQPRAGAKNAGEGPLATATPRGVFKQCRWCRLARFVITMTYRHIFGRLYRYICLVFLDSSRWAPHHRVGTLARAKTGVLLREGRVEGSK